MQLISTVIPQDAAHPRPTIPLRRHLPISALLALLEAPCALEVRDAADTPDAAEACKESSYIIRDQLAQMAELKAQDISIPPYLAGYYSAISSGRQEIGCPNSLCIDAHEFTPKKQPCDVIDEQHGRMMVLTEGFRNESISAPPFIAGFLAAVQDGYFVLRCPPYTDTTAADDSSNSGSE